MCQPHTFWNCEPHSASCTGFSYKNSTSKQLLKWAAADGVGSAFSAPGKQVRWSGALSLQVPAPRPVEPISAEPHPQSHFFSPFPRQKMGTTVSLLTIVQMKTSHPGRTGQFRLQAPDYRGQATLSTLFSQVLHLSKQGGCIQLPAASLCLGPESGFYVHMSHCLQTKV